MELEHRTIVYDATARPAKERIAFFTGLCCLRSGEILCGFQIGSTKHAPDGTIRIYASADEGQTWRERCANFESRLPDKSGELVPGSLAAAELVEAEPGRLLLFTTWFDRSEPDRPLFDPVTEGILRSKLLIAVSNDDGATWSAWQQIPTPGLTGCATTGPIVRWSNGAIGFAFESFKEFDDPKPGRHAAWVVISADGGESFSVPVRVAQHPEHKIYYWDQRLCVGDNGEFTALFWTHNIEQKRDLNVHLRHGKLDSSGQRVELDLQPIRETTIPGQIAAPVWLPDGRLLAFVVDRHTPGTLKLWVSHDRGATWPASESILVHSQIEQAAVTQGLTNIDFKQYWEDMGKWSFGHPAVRSLPDNRLLVAWYSGSPDCMSIHSARYKF